MTRARALFLALLASALVSFAAPVAVAEPVSTSVVVAVAGPVARQQQAPEPGPKIDPADNQRANSEKVKNKVIVGVAAVVLLLIVLWGRKVRGKNQKKADAQAKGK
ncbi:hypothetical protein [Amycolatopsis anabasis]|uniref:hypothetical protein n=1 Tax=Amycolatopsis anabasis TaxID=1840409 RepID=UPI00131E9121|nr:hypothetical protein [Amycolatopsis anabasis]